jgi:hypothetical protein
MQSAEVASAGSCRLFVLAKELQVHGDEQLLAVFPKACIASDGLDHIETDLVVAAGDREVAQQPRQGAGLQLQGAFQVWHLARRGQGAARFPLRDGGMAHAKCRGQFALRPALPYTTLAQEAAELCFLRRSRHVGLSSTGASAVLVADSIAHSCGHIGERPNQNGLIYCHIGNNALESRHAWLDRPECRHG